MSLSLTIQSILSEHDQIHGFVGHPPTLPGNSLKDQPLERELHEYMQLILWAFRVQKLHLTSLPV